MVTCPACRATLSPHDLGPVVTAALVEAHACPAAPWPAPTGSPTVGLHLSYVGPAAMAAAMKVPLLDSARLLSAGTPGLGKSTITARLLVVAYYRSPYERAAERIGVIADRRGRHTWHGRLLANIVRRIEQADLAWIADVANRPAEDRPATRLRSVLDGE